MTDNEVVLAYLLRRWYRTPYKATAIYSVRMPNGEWRHTMVDRARTWSLVIELGRHVVEFWIRERAA